MFDFEKKLFVGIDPGMNGGIAFIKPETTVEGLNDAEIDTLGQAIIQKYLVIEKKANGGVV